MKWIEQFRMNYDGKSQEAKDLEKFLKTNYNGSSYLPWAVMERLTYMQDEDADFAVIRNDDGGVVHTDTMTLETYAKADEVEKQTAASMFAHFIVLRLTFLGKVFEEVYPIQDNAYKPPKVYDQNMVNKAIQRAKAKLVSRATGLGLPLYEGSDLQFEEEEVKPKKTTSKPKEVVKDVKEPKVATTTKDVDTSKFADLLDFIVNDENAVVGLQKINASVAKKYGFTINPEDEDLPNKLAEIASPTTFLRTLKKQSGVA